jgi:hypothetical protein
MTNMRVGEYCTLIMIMGHASYETKHTKEVLTREQCKIELIIQRITSDVQVINRMEPTN